MQTSIVTKRATGLGLPGALLSLACSSGAVDVGVESVAFNLERCYETECPTRPKATMLEEGQASQECDAESAPELERLGELALPSSFEQVDLVATADGVWALGTTSNGAVRLARVRLDGTVALSDVLMASGNHTSLEQDIVEDDAGNAIVAIYSVTAETADAVLKERLQVYRFNPALELLGDPIPFVGGSLPKLAAGETGTFTVSGNQRNNGASGALAYYDGDSVEWIQNRVPTSGRGAGVGMSDLAVDAAGRAYVISQRSPRWSGGPDLYRYGVARFASDGTMDWDTELPTEFTGGYHADIAAHPDGGVVLAGYVGELDDFETRLVRRMTKDGKLGWRYTFNSMGGAMAVDPDSGQVFVAGFNALAVIASDGSSCVLHHGTGGDVAVAGGRMYALGWGTVEVFAVPAP